MSSNAGTVSPRASSFSLPPFGCVHPTVCRADTVGRAVSGGMLAGLHNKRIEHASEKGEQQHRELAPRKPRGSRGVCQTSISAVATCRVGASSDDRWRESTAYVYMYWRDIQHAPGFTRLSTSGAVKETDKNHHSSRDVRSTPLEGGFSSFDVRCATEVLARSSIVRAHSSY